jgi:hypothetical protein
VEVRFRRNLPSSQTADNTSAGYRSMADWYDVLEFRLEDTVAQNVSLDRPLPAVLSLLGVTVPIEVL